jgi:hypothetical protein
MWLRVPLSMFATFLMVAALLMMLVPGDRGGHV